MVYQVGFNMELFVLYVFLVVLVVLLKVVIEVFGNHQKSIGKQQFATICPFKKHGGGAGRMCEVGLPASGLSFFTCPYSHLAVLNGNPALRGWFQA